MPLKKYNTEQVEQLYSNFISTLIEFTKPKDLYVVGGRGLAKTQDILAKRLINIFYDMPGAPISLVSDTYVNAITNILPNIITGFERQGFIEQEHWVSDCKPPDHFDNSKCRILDFKHVISTFNGCRLLIKSLDRPSSNAGISVVHIVGDEAKYLKEDKLKKALPTVRGDIILFGRSPYFMGHTFLTDIPNAANNEDDWIFQQELHFDALRTVDIINVFLQVNEIQKELHWAIQEKAAQNVIAKIERKLQQWQERFRVARLNSNLFLVSSSLANIDILTFEYVINNYKTLEYEEFKRAILSVRSSLERGARFYPNLMDHHFYDDGFDYEYYDAFNLKDKIVKNSQGLKYIEHNKILEAGFDAGNMMSLVMGQEQGKVYRVLKDLHTLTPDWLRELANEFILYFKPHKLKYLHLYYDRAANQYSKAKRDLASQLKHDIEYDAFDKPTGWVVDLKSLGQGNITHSEEYDLMITMMGAKDNRLPEILIDKFECKNLRSSLMLAPAEKNSKGFIQKVKKSEKLPLNRLPSESTNFSDAFKVLMCRRKYLHLVKRKDYTVE